MPGEEGQGSVSDETELLAYNAAPSKVEEALNKLGNVMSFSGANFTVTGGPGDEGGTKPYLITFDGSLVGRGGLEEGRSIEVKDSSLTGGQPSSLAGLNVEAEGSAASEVCVPANHDVCNSKGIPGEGEGQFGLPVGIAVDQATGNVYVLNAGRTNGVVQVFSAEGKYLSDFGIQGGQNEPITKNPELIRTVHGGGIAIDSTTGNVYIVDHDGANPSEGRVMVFKPSAHGYAYETSFALNDGPEEIAIDSTGNVYVTGNRRFVYRFAVGDLSVPEWAHEDNKEVSGLTVNPRNGDIFYYTDLNRRFHSYCQRAKSRPAEARAKELNGRVWKLKRK